jgi:hypothetical protein
LHGQANTSDSPDPTHYTTFPEQHKASGVNVKGRATVGALHFCQIALEGYHW